MTKLKASDFAAVPELPALPVPARQRPDPPPTQHDKDRAARAALECSEADLRTRAAQLEAAYGGPVEVVMPSGRRVWLGGEALVSALANGGVQASEYVFKRTTNGIVTDQPRVRVW